MKDSGIEVHKEKRINTAALIVRILALLLALFAFMLSLDMMGSSFKLLGQDIAQQIINATSNPFISLFIGLLATAIVQSSSVTTSMIVAIVASGTLPLDGAVPMVMGANIGTTITSTLVSLAHITDKKEFRKAIAVATMHDFFNILVTVILFPLEYYFGWLSRVSLIVTNLITSTGQNPGELVRLTVRPISSAITGLVNQNAFILLAISVLLLLGSIKYLSLLLKYMLIGESQKKVEKYIFGTPGTSLFWGTVLTGAIQSSSFTTSLVVPIAATNKISVKRAFPFIMGSNMGTTLTALIAAVSQSKTALSIAMAHVLFNVIGVLIFFPIPAIRSIPVQLSRRLGRLTIKNRAIGFVYIVITFFLIPFLLIYFTRSEPLPTKTKPAKEIRTKKVG